MATADAFL